jgi:Holliday junction resolvasome RuvABC endonuclease subunit
MNFLALDLGLKTGWAIQLTDGTIASGVQEFKVNRGTNPDWRFVQFRAWLIALLNDHQVDYVAYEQAHMREGHATDILVGFTTRVREICVERGSTPYLAVHSATIKLASTGSGRADKGVMMAAARTKYPGIDIIDDNHADALCLLEYVRAQLEDPLVISSKGRKPRRPRSRAARSSSLT